MNCLLLNLSLSALLLLTAVQARPQLVWRTPQQFATTNNINNNNFNLIDTSTAASAQQVTTASPQYIACMRRCPSTMQYNPICGNDNESYANEGRLLCARMCGRDVAAVRQGTCQPL